MVKIVDSYRFENELGNGCLMFVQKQLGSARSGECMRWKRGLGTDQRYLALTQKVEPMQHLPTQPQHSQMQIGWSCAH